MVLLSLGVVEDALEDLEVFCVFQFPSQIFPSQYPSQISPPFCSHSFG